MKYFLGLLFLCHLSLAQNQNDENISFDKAGFTTCYKAQDKTYFFNWDPYVKTLEKNVTYFEASDYQRVTSHKLRSCKDQKYIIAQIPSEILFDISNIGTQLPDSVLASVQQVSHGAHLFRNEKTALEYIQNRKDIFQADHPEVLTQLRYDVGEDFAGDVMKIFMRDIVVKNKSCDSFIGTCDFYLCQEQKNPCGLDGYNLDFGYKYCSGSKFKLLDQMNTDLGKSWVTDVFQCLQKASFARGQQTCADIKKDSYSSHPGCYVQAGFCQLKGSEKLNIFGLIKKEIFSSQTLVQGVDIIKKCAAEKD